ncbi:MAG TPA: hypothetical protein VNL71_00435, partial [Chloroflexota bacterium]|nr:hypothetical protein [Chloroflexota bacterium]
MGLMMWMMMRGNGHSMTEQPRPGPGADLAGLRQQLDAVEQQQAAIVDQIKRLTEGDESAVPEAAAALTRPLASASKPQV